MAPVGAQRDVEERVQDGGLEVVGSMSVSSANFLTSLAM